MTHALHNVEYRQAGKSYRVGYSRSGLRWHIVQTGFYRFPYDPPGFTGRLWLARCINQIHPGTINAFYAPTLDAIDARLDTL